MYKVKSPILFLFFNRLEETKRVFQAIKDSKPEQLFLASDGPRQGQENEASTVESIREYIINNIDWECNIFTLFRDENLGCKKAVSQAITWFFDQIEEGIILEDDCLPNNDFFRFCDLQLNQYRYDDRIGHICGCNFQDGIKRGGADYYYSKLTHVWGWASWKRVWSVYDINMAELQNAYKEDILSAVTDNQFAKAILYESFFKTRNGLINTWDFQYFFSNLINGYFSIIPNYNMISNIGFNANGTHTFNSNSLQANIDHENLPLLVKEPSVIYQNRMADEYTLTKELPKRYIFITNKLKQLIKLCLIKSGLYKSKSA
ncbi:nucleotide-diphospho-sugar transferase [Pedobacter alluvionis]|uniref:Nucleotide-diphospho-sugar transferase n=1 Tax=Pedobacter alluvionis TaxID=475253 RepID=A0A497XY32_9SPHI|nr:nucleotide-diphospho-sugar transferase [Pedobacter alluvionis]RLJ73892.1 hypothetical protein BCL90_4058 [Pedobacter alluvionis]TFB32501.1 nucleotide-diphospho-sugar transferase [Pedobacter alluvionis]